MSDLDAIIKINIERQTAAVEQTDFSTVLFITPHTQWPERARVYNSITAVAEDFSTTSAAYIAATRAFGQKLTPLKFIIGRRQIPAVTVSVATVANSTLYTLTVSDEVFNYTSDVSATAVEIATGLADAYSLNAVDGVTAVNNLDGTISFTSTVDWSITSSANLSIVTASPTETWADSYLAVKEENNDWYCVTVDTRTVADIIALADLVSADERLMIVASASTDIIGSGDTDLLSQLKAAGYDRVAGIYHDKAGVEYVDVAAPSYRLQQKPGSNTWNLSTLVGVTAQKMTNNAKANVIDKNGSYYSTRGGLNVLEGVRVASGEWIDVIVGVDWLKARMQEELFLQQYYAPKIGMTNAGFASIEAKIKAVLQEGVASGLLADTPPPQVFAPDPLSLSTNDRANRRATGFRFTARLAGAVHYTQVDGTVGI